MAIRFTLEGDDYPEGYWENHRDHQQIKPRHKPSAKDIEYRNKKIKQNEEAAAELNRKKDVVMNALDKQATEQVFTGNEYQDAAEAQRQDKIEKFHERESEFDKVLGALELGAAGYGLIRGASHIGQYLSRRFATSTGSPLSRNSLNWARRFSKLTQKVDVPQAVVSGVGTSVDGVEMLRADNNFDRYENAFEAGAGTAGFIGGLNVFRDMPGVKPIFRRYGNTIDTTLDALGYGAVGWDIAKRLPPLEDLLNRWREESLDAKQRRSLENGGQ